MLQAVEDFDTFALFYRRFMRWAENEEIDLAVILKALAMKANSEEVQTFTSALIYFQHHVLSEEERAEFLATLKTHNHGSDTVDMSDEESD